VLVGDEIRLLTGSPYEGCHYNGQVLSLASTHLLAPCQPGKIIAIGINYIPHAAELDFAVPAEPLIFLKPPSALIGPGEAVMLPAMSSQVEYEGELAVVIGRQTRSISQDQALSAVLGYTCINDVTARDLQKRDVQFTRSKSFDTFAPLGPWIETDLDPADVMVETRLNGELRQQANTKEMVRSVAELISFISGIMTLLPGDIIATGTPAGVGPMAHGDEVQVAVAGIGPLVNPVVAEKE